MAKLKIDGTNAAATIGPDNRTHVCWSLELIHYDMPRVCIKEQNWMFLQMVVAAILVCIASVSTRL